MSTFSELICFIFCPKPDETIIIQEWSQFLFKSGLLTFLNPDLVEKGSVCGPHSDAVSVSAASAAQLQHQQLQSSALARRV